MKKHVKGKYASSSIRQAAEVVMEELDDLECDILMHSGDLCVEGNLATFRPPGAALFVVDGNLDVKGSFENAMDPTCVVIVTGDLSAQNVINGGFLEVHGAVRASVATLFVDNDPCSEIFGDVEAPFVFTQYHSARIHGRLIASLYTGDDDTLETKAQKKKERGFVCETDLRVRPRLSPALLTVLAEEIFDAEPGQEPDEEDGWIDYIDSEKLIDFLRKGGVPLNT